MDIFKLFSRLFAAFGVLMMFGVSGWGACIGDNIANWTTSTTAYNSGDQKVRSDSNNQDNYTITVNAEGSLDIRIANTDGSYFLKAYLYSGSTCSNTPLQTITVNSNAVQTLTINPVTNGSTYSLQLVGERSDHSTDYNLRTTFTPVASSAYRDFTLRTQLYARGNMKTIGNTILVNPTGSKTTNNCSTYTNGTFLDGDGSTSNDGYYLCGYSVDGTQTNATTSELALPSGAKVIWAGLYWQSIVANGDWNSNMTIKFRKDGDSYQNISPDQLDYQADSGAAGYTSYSAFKNVTSYFGENKWNEGNYTVSNIPVYEGKIPSLGSYGAWSLVAVYEVDGELFRSFSVFDGWKVIKDVAGYRDVTIPVSGFYTPNKTNINASVSMFAAEGDAYFGSSYDTRDVLSTLDYHNNSVVNLGTANNTFHSAVTGGGFRTPNMVNNMGIDIQTFDIGAYLIPRQESMNFTFTTRQDTFWPSLIAFSTEIYAPSFCYDYGYKQNGISFTEENTGLQLPRITGTLPTAEDLNVSIYIRNTEVSDIAANNTKLSINNIDTTQAIYKRDSVEVTLPQEFIPTAKSDALWPLSVSDSFVRDIPIGNIGSAQYIYTYYGLTPNAAGDINMSIDGSFSYDLTIARGDGTQLILPYTSTIGGAQLPMCSSGNFSYTPEWGIFSVVDAGLYNSAAANRYYNLTTQVAKRPANLRIAAFDATLTDTPKSVSTTVAVELIDASQYHDVDAACHEPSSAMTPRVWVTFDNNVSQVNFNRDTINTAIANGAVSDGITQAATTLANAEDFFKKATINAAYRVSFNVTNDGNDSLVQTAPGTQPGETKILNFTQLVQDIQHCTVPVEIPNNPSNTTTLVAVACGNAGNQGIDKHNLAICMECLYGHNTNILCSRDNFAIRPESYTVNLKDINQTTNATLNAFATDRTGVLTPNSARVDMAGGYIYNYEINATNHIDNANTEGYTRNFTGASNDFNLTFVWEPTTPKTGCNDTNSSPQNFYLSNGAATANASMNNVGEYRLNIIDKTWTAVDWVSAFQGHQTGSHFLAGDDCVANSTIVPVQADVISLNGGAINNLVGCDISSEHDNFENSLKYRDYLMTFHPYQFNVGLTHGLGATAVAIAAGGEGFVYDANLANTNEMNMSVRSTGTISAVGFGGNQLSNFVKECYAKDLNITMGHNANTTLATPFVSRVIHSSVATGIEVFDSNETNIGANVMRSAVDDSNFTKIDNGAVATAIRLNFDRNQTTPLDPQIVHYSDINITCASTGECSRQADGTVDDANGTNIMNFDATHVYGRIIPRDVRVFGANTPFTANGWYEVFNTPSILGTGLAASRNEAMWYVNQLHNDINYGDANVTIVITGSNPTNTTAVGGIESYNFTGMALGGYKAHIDTDPWLWYGAHGSPYSDPSALNLNCLTHPCFNINVVPAVGATGSAKSTNEGTKDSKASSSGGTGWHSTTDYAPAIR